MLFHPPGLVYYWIALILWALIYHAGLRLFFLFKHWHLANELPISELFISFVYGAKFDFVIIGYITLPFILISFIPYIGFEYSILTRKILQPVMYFLFAIVFLLSFVDVEYFGEFGDHLGVWFYAYLDNFDLVWYTIAESYPVFWYITGWILISALFIFISNKFNRFFKRERGSNPVSNLIYSILILALMIVGIRGGISLAPIDWGLAYHSNYYFANELSLNGIYTLSKNIFEYHDDISRHNPSKYKFYDHREALRTVQDLVSSPGDSLIEPDRSLKRFTAYPDTDRPAQNVVFIVMESWSATYVGALGGTPPVTPFFDSLAQKSLLFENFFASGLRTNRGLLSILCSFPSLPGRTVMKLYGSAHPFSSIADILKQDDYRSYFIYGGDLNFDNMGGFFRMKGFENFMGIDDFDYDSRLNKWGAPDHITFERANKLFSEAYPEPFIGVVLTLTNHRPFALPDKRFEIFSPDVKYYDHLNAFYYSDWALGHFFKLAQKEKYFSNTIFVLVADHGQVLRHPDEVIKNYKIASLIYCPGREDIIPGRIETVCGQVDLLPTVLGLLGKPATHESWGRDILALDPSDSGFAFINKGDTYGWIEGSHLLLEKINVKTQLFQIEGDSYCSGDISISCPELAQSMQRKGRSILQLEVKMVHDIQFKRQ